MIKNRFFNFLLILLILCCTQYSCEKKSIKNEYNFDEKWSNVSNDIELGNPTGLSIDINNNLVVFHRAYRGWQQPMPTEKIKDKTIVTIDNNTGELLNSWGDEIFIMPHGLEVDHENNIWVTDVGLHQIFKFDSNGNLLLKIGEEGISGDDESHFNLPTDIAVSKDGSFYVSDGYGNSRIIKFSSTGQYLFEWGKFGKDEGEFNIPHGIDLDKYENIYVADRENNRIQKFDKNGNFISLWQNTITEQLYSVSVENNEVFGIDYWIIEESNDKRSNIFRFDLDLKLNLRFDTLVTFTSSNNRYHDITVDKNGTIYVGDILENKVQKYKRKIINN